MNLRNKSTTQISSINQPYKSINHERQDIPWENTPNTDDEKPNNSSSMIDRFAENGLQHIRILPDKRYHLSSREERSNATMQKKLYATIMNLPYA